MEKHSRVANVEKDYWDNRGRACINDHFYVALFVVWSQTRLSAIRCQSRNFSACGFFVVLVTSKASYTLFP